ncbi:MAG: hypothetical protein R3D55_12040 [Chloroflexota bacterium]
MHKAYRRLAGGGKKRAIIAVARTLLSSFWYMLTRGEAYKDLGGDYFDQRRKDVKVNVLTRQLANWVTQSSWSRLASRICLNHFYFQRSVVMHSTKLERGQSTTEYARCCCWLGALVAALLWLGRNVFNSYREVNECLVGVKYALENSSFEADSLITSSRKAYDSSQITLKPRQLTTKLRFGTLAFWA